VHSSHLLAAALVAAALLPAPAAHAGTFATKPPGAWLPSGGTCAGRIADTTREHRPNNYTANGTRAERPLDPIDGAAKSWTDRFATRKMGNYGPDTTDDILEWASCKWGLSDDLTRARAIQESNWNQSQLGDQTSSSSACATIGKPVPCWQSYGILQVKGTVHEETYPAAERSTAFNADYASAWQRACLDGSFDWLGSGYVNDFNAAKADWGNAAKRDRLVWGCVGTWYSGEWYQNNDWYIADVRRHLSEKRWLQAGF
jgi:autotransporter family porin